MDGTQIPTNIPKSLLSGLSIKKKRYIENKKDRIVAANTYFVALSILPHNKFMFFLKFRKRITPIIPPLKNSVCPWSNQL